MKVLHSFRFFPSEIMKTSKKTCFVRSLQLFTMSIHHALLTTTDSCLGSSLTNMLILIGWKPFFSQPIIFIVILKLYLGIVLLQLSSGKLKSLFLSVKLCFWWQICSEREEKQSLTSCQYYARDQERNYAPELLHTDTFVVFRSTGK